MRSIAVAVSGIGIIAALTAGFAFAQSGATQYPARPVRFIVPFTAGGGNDIVARSAAQKLSEQWGQQVICDNRVGANGIIGTDLAAKSTPDGYTIVLVSTSFTMNPSIAKMPFDPQKDLVPIGFVAEGPLMLSAHPGFAGKNIKELMTLARAKPGEIQFASSGFGGVTHLAGELFQRMAKISLGHVPYKGSSAGALDVVAGQVALMISSVSPALPYLQSGRLRALGMGSLKRSALLPDVPTIAEQGVPGYDSSMWWGVMAPKGTPALVVSKISQGLTRGMQADDVNKRLGMLGMSSLTGTPEELRKAITDDMEKWGKIIKEIGITQLAQ
jgi:tripartite-type tricarboxylate transporter receptor subunit TctC